jgi:peptidoglycan/LPS O-acetylase OafA/YrhL
LGDKANAVNSDFMTKRFLALDGMRFILVMCVLAHHAVLPGFKAGFIAVDSFFVLSGFVISLLVCTQINSNEFKWGRFIRDRFIRLWPALFLTLACSAPIVYLFGQETRLELLRHTLQAISYTTNLARSLSIGNANLYFGHIWSLSMEWQFYVAWSAFVLALLNIFGKYPGFFTRIICSASLILAIGVALWRTYNWSAEASFVRFYFGPDFRADGVLLGCGLGAAYSMWGNTENWPRSKLMLPLGSILFILLMWHYSGSEHNYITWGIPIINSISVILIIGGIAAQGMIGAFLSSHWLTVGGRLSYGMYLWHYPIFRLLDDAGMRSSVSIMLVGGVISTACSWLSLTYFEPVAKVWLLRRFARH